MAEIRRISLVDRVREELSRRMRAGELLPGERLNETALAEQLGVSATPIREALLGLEQDTYVRSSPGKGFVVAALDAREMLDIYCVLAELDATALRMARFDEVTLATLRELEHECRLASDDVGAIAADVRWHTTLVASCPNSYLLEQIELSRRAASRYEHALLCELPHRSALSDHHEAIIDALAGADIEGAVRWLTVHWRELARQLHGVSQRVGSDP